MSRHHATVEEIYGLPRSEWEFISGEFLDYFRPHREETTGLRLDRRVMLFPTGWVAATRGWKSPPCTTPQGAVTYAEIELWGGESRLLVSRGELVLEYGDGTTRFEGTGVNVALCHGENEFEVSVPRTGSIVGTRVGPQRTKLARPVIVVAGDNLNLKINLTLD